MPELVACPLCGCKVQMTEAMLGQQVRCLACQASFTASAQGTAPPGPGTAASRSSPASRKPVKSASRQPFCPACGRAVSWDDPVCPSCGEEFEVETVPPLNLEPLRRRDAEPHRGPLLTTLGNIALVSGGVSICLFGLGMIVSLPLGVLTWALANNDLSRMQSGVMDPSGKEATEAGRTCAILGIVLGILFAACYAIWWWNRW